MVAAVVGALGRLLLDGPCDLRVGVAQEKGAVAHHVVDDIVAVHVPLVAPLSVVDVERKGGQVPSIVGDP